MKKWAVHTKGGPNEESWEICVVREDNLHGVKSYGWFDEDKIFISSSGGPCREKVNQRIWNALVEVAEEEARYLNESLIE